MKVFRTKDHPEANGRKAEAGERQYTLTFPLEGGEFLTIHTGQKAFDCFRKMIEQMDIDDAAGGQVRDFQL